MGIHPMILFITFLILAAVFFYLFLRDKQHQFSPLWLMLSTWMLGIGIPQLHLSRIEKDWYPAYWLLLVVSLCTFVIGYYVVSRFIDYLDRRNVSEAFRLPSNGGLKTSATSAKHLRLIIYVLFLISCFSLFLFHTRAGNFPLLAPDTDVFRFVADEQVPGLINYTAQFARLFIPLSFFLIFWQGFAWKKHWDLVILILLGTVSLTLFASRTQIFFVDLWVMAMYLLMRRPNLKQALKFYPIFLLISILVLAAVPFYRQYKSYGTTDYLAGVTAINSSGFNPLGKALLPIYVGVSFNQQALLHAYEYYQTHPIQQGRVTLDPFTNILGLDQFKSNFDLCEIFKCWWNTGTYLFPFVQDFGKAAFIFMPVIFSGIFALLWHYWKIAPNFLSINLYAYACFFIVMTIYLSFTVRAEMYLDLFMLFASYLIISKYGKTIHQKR